IEGSMCRDSADDALGDHRLGSLHRIGDLSTLRELCGDSGGQGAAGARYPLPAHLRCREDVRVLPVVEDVNGVLTREFGTTLGQHVLRSQLVDALRRLSEVLDGLDAV